MVMMANGLVLKLSEATGWDAIQESMLNHDGDKLGDFADDIDTLLVFVRDFSVKFCSHLPMVMQ